MQQQLLTSSMKTFKPSANSTSNLNQNTTTTTTNNNTSSTNNNHHIEEQTDLKVCIL